MLGSCPNTNQLHLLKTSKGGKDQTDDVEDKYNI